MRRRHFQAGTVKLIILDRDGVINQDSDAFVKSPDEWIALPGSLQAIARLTQAGWKVVVATNQSGLARGLFDMDTLNAIHAKMRRELAPPAAASTPSPVPARAGRQLRSPQAAARHVRADRRALRRQPERRAGGGRFALRDLQASSAAGCAPWLVLTGNGAKTQALGGLRRQRGLTRWPGSVRCFTPFS